MINRVLYQAPQSQFISEVERNMVSQKMRHTAEQAGIHSAENEIASWENNAPHVARLLTQCGAKDSYVTFEFLVPFSRKRIDCMIYGTGEDDSENVIHIELKQWSNKTVGIADSDGNFTADDTANRQPDDVVFNVEAFTGHANRIVAHPSQQVKGYQGYLSNFIEVFSNHEVSLTGLAYCYNYAKNASPSYLYDSKYSTLLSQYPTYAKDQFDELTEKLTGLLKKGAGLSIFNKVIQSPVRPSKKLLNEVKTMVENGDTSTFALIDDQIVARNMILDKIRPYIKNGEFQKSVIIVNGGPGTGKTVIALHILAELAKQTNNGQGLNVQYATKSASLLGGVKSKVRPATRILFQNITSYYPAVTDENAVDVLLIDEAHRIEKTTNTRYTKAENKTDLPMVDTIIRASKVSVFFIDDKQAIRGREIGSSKMIREAAARWKAKVEECTLTSQFRCNGSDNYMDWMEQVLYNRPVTSKFKLSDFNLQILDSPQEMYNQLVEQDSVPGQTARIMAGFCWKWSDKLDENGDLIKDVEIGDFKMPWETHRNFTRTPRGYVKWYEWAYKPEGIKQVGCIYTAQGFEFDYAGVIIGPDLIYNTETHRIETEKSATRDPMLKNAPNEAIMTYDDYVRNIYRVLMSRGMKGCFLYICDENLRNYMKQLLAEMKGQ
ncbi:MAG: DUF2075 domain-containing protein [Prevotella sp.]|nr:DUF2075 domain-containing protein [Prevotella sp.]